MMKLLIEDFCYFRQKTKFKTAASVLQYEPADIETNKIDEKNIIN